MVFTVRDMPHFAPYLQFLVNIIQIHFARTENGGQDYFISGAIDRSELDGLYHYLNKLKPGETIVIKERDARVLYASFVVVSRMLICDYGEEICHRLIARLPTQHPWAKYEAFRNTLLRHNAQMLLDMDTNMAAGISGLEQVKKKLELVSL